MRRRLPLFLTSLLLLGACGGDFKSSYFAPTAALVCGRISCAKIPESKIAEQLSSVLADPESAKPFKGPNSAANRLDAQRDILGHLIRDEVTIQKARRDLNITPASVKSAADAKFTEIRGQFESKEAWDAQLAQEGLSETALRTLLLNDEILQKVQETVGSNEKATPAEVEQFYQLNKSQYDEQVNISHILVCADFVAQDRKCNGPSADDQTRAQQVLARARAGEDFAALAREFSVDTVSKEAGGEIGFASRGDLVPELESAAFSLAKPGDISDPIKTQFGLHIVKLNAIGKPLDVAKPDIEEGLTQRKQVRAFDEWVIAAIKDADVKVNAKLGKYDQISQLVVPLDTETEEAPAANPSPAPISTALPSPPASVDEPAIPEEPVQDPNAASDS